MKKRMVSLVLVLAMLLACVPLVATAATSGECGDDLTWTLDDEGTLTISGTGEMADWTASSKMPWYSIKENIKKVVIQNGVTTIGDYAFWQCGELTSIEIPNSVTSIGESAFYNCSSLTSIEIPNSVTKIGENAFSHCGGLTSVTIPNSVTKIGENAFFYCGGLTSIEISNSVTRIEPKVFYGCSGLTSVTIPNSVTYIGGSAFSGCSSLSNVYYSGTEEEWTNITISSYNQSLTDATIYYNSVMPTPTPAPTPKPRNFIVDYDNGTITNDGETAQEATVIIALYDDGILQKIEASKMTFDANETKQISLDDNTKVFVWDSLDGMYPLTK